MGWAFSLSDAVNTMEASRSTTVTPVSSRPATLSHGNPCRRAASSPHQCRRNEVIAAFDRVSCTGPISDNVRHTVGVKATGPITGARCRNPWESLIASPPRTCIRVTSIRTCCVARHSFAALCGVSPLEASWGPTSRRRLNRGDRQANAALYRIALSRLRWDARTRDYFDRRITEGKTRREAIRCLKRYIAREVYQIITSPPETQPSAA